MSRHQRPSCPFRTKVLGHEILSDLLPASYHTYVQHHERPQRLVAKPESDLNAFLVHELSLGELGGYKDHLWLVGSKHPPTRLHLQVAMGREIVVADRMDLHLVWQNDGRMFLKPLPGFLLAPNFWAIHLDCPEQCQCEMHKEPHNQQPQPVDQEILSTCRKSLREVALGFLYTYACLVCSELDFEVATEKGLLPRTGQDSKLAWPEWKTLVREVLEAHGPDHVSSQVHPRFHRGELRLSRLNFLHRVSHPLAFQPYLRGWRNYSSLFRDNLTWMATATIFIALALTAMQVGLATKKLQDSPAFQRASVGFTVFAILGPLSMFGLVVLWALLNLAKDVPWLFGVEGWKRRTVNSVV